MLLTLALAVALILFCCRRLATALGGRGLWILAATFVLSYLIWPEAYNAIILAISSTAGTVKDYFIAPISRSISCTEDCLRTMLQSYFEQPYPFSLLTETDFPTAVVLSGVVGAAFIFLALTVIGDRLARATVDIERNKSTALLAFFAIILFSFYLSLTALLTIPFMQKEQIQDGFSVVDFEASLDKALPTRAAFDARVQPFLLSTGDKQAEKEEVRTALEKSQVVLNATYQRLLDNKTRATELFRAQSAVGLGGRETVVHFSVLVQWFIDQRAKREAILDNCLTAASRYARLFNSSLFSTIDSPLTSDAEEEDVQKAAREVDYACYTVEPTSEGDDIPQRSTRASTLPIVGSWSGWLINSESMPLTIIVGLVGFSFLGASLSRFVRAGQGRAEVWLSVEDLVIVVISGATAALAVFVASYGGLAVLSQSDASADPNPYLVFILCLAAAIYSEDIWPWLRTTLLSQITPADDTGITDPKTGELTPAEQQAAREAAEKAAAEPKGDLPTPLPQP